MPKRKNPIKTEQIVLTFYSKGGNISQTAKALKIDAKTALKHINSPEGQALLKEMRQRQKDTFLMAIETAVLKSLENAKDMPAEKALAFLSDFLGFSGPARMAKAQLKQNTPEQAQSQTQGATEEEIQRFTAELKKRREKK